MAIALHRAQHACAGIATAGFLIYVADAVTGKRIPSVKLEFFGYHQDRIKKPKTPRKYNILSKFLTKTTGKDGTLILKDKELSGDYQWMIMLFFSGRAFGARLSLIPISISRLYRGIYKGKMPLAGGENAIFFAPAADITVNFKGNAFARTQKRDFSRLAGKTVYSKGKMPLKSGKLGSRPLRFR